MSSSSSTPEYLLASFEPSRALVSQLRSILLSHDVPYPANAKKPQLVALYEQHVRPKAPRLLAELFNVRASADGILDGESQDGSLAELDTDSETEKRAARSGGSAAKKRTKSVARKKATRRETLEPATEASELLASTSKAQPSADSSSPRLKPSDATATGQTSPRKRKAEAKGSPHLPELHATPAQPLKKRESNFSDYNPFQSGAEDTPGPYASKRRRKSSTDTKTVEKSDNGKLSGRHSMPNMPRQPQQSSSPARHDSEHDIAAAPVVSSERSPAPFLVAGEKYMAPTSSIKRPPSTAADLRRRVDRSPAPSRQIEQHSGGAKPSPSTPRLRIHSSSGARLQPNFHRRVSSVRGRALAVWRVCKIVAVLGLSLATLACAMWFREQKVSLGFCDTGSNTNTRLTQLRDATNESGTIFRVAEDMHLAPTCTPCPAHGSCTDGKLLGCLPNYVVKPHPLRMGGLWPLPPSCAPDTEKLMFVAREASRALQLLKAHRGEVICSRSSERARQRSGRAEAWIYGLDCSALRQALRAQNLRSNAPLAEHAYEEIYRLALRDLQEHGETVQEEIDGELWVASISAVLPLSCRLRRSAQATAARHMKLLIGFVTLLVSAAVAKVRLRRYLLERKRVASLVGLTFGELQKQEHLHAVDPALAPSPHVIQNHLRDLVLQDEHSPSVRARLWKAVSKVVESNSNVRSKQVEHCGEDMLAWEWSGATKPDTPRQVLYPSVKRG
ncbi:hypothetical protein ACM66B_004833 [Microbotryomycetes sp. NB124-2]